MSLLILQLHLQLRESLSFCKDLLGHLIDIRFQIGSCSFGSRPQGFHLGFDIPVQAVDLFLKKSDLLLCLIAFYVLIDLPLDIGEIIVLLLI